MFPSVNNRILKGGAIDFYTRILGLENTMVRGIATKTLIYTFSGALPALAGFFLLAPLTQFLSRDLYAIQALYLSISLLFQVIITYGLDQFLVRNYVNSKDEAYRADLVSQVFSSILLIGVLLFTVFAFTGSFSFELILQSSDAHFFPFGALSIGAALFNSLIKAFTNLLIYKEDPLRFLWVNVINTFVYIVGVFVGLHFFPETLWGPVGGRFLAGFVGVVIVFSYLFRKEKFRFHFGFPKGSLAYCAPVLLFGAVMWGMSLGNNYLINYAIHDLGHIAEFDLLLKFVMIIELFHNGLTSALSPKLFRLWSEKNRGEEEHNLHILFNAVSILLIASSVLLLPVFWPLVVKNHAFDHVVWLFPLIAFGYAFRGIYNYYVNPIYFMEKTHRLPIVFALSFVIHAVIAFFLIKEFKLVGALAGMSLSRVVQSIILRLVNHDLKPTKEHYSTVVLAPGIYAALLVALFFIVEPGVILNILQFALALLLVGLFYGKALWAMILRNKNG